MKRISLFVALAIAFAISISCCPCRKGSSSADFNLISTSWQLTQINGRSVKPQQGEYTIMFGEDDRVGGVAKCNNITGSYVYSPELRSLKFEHMGMTRMMCQGEEFEDEYGRMLHEVTHYEVDGDMLILLSNGESVGVLRKL